MATILISTFLSSEKKAGRKGRVRRRRVLRIDESIITHIKIYVTTSHRGKYRVFYYNTITSQIAAYTHHQSTNRWGSDVRIPLPKKMVFAMYLSLIKRKLIP